MDIKALLKSPSQYKYIDTIVNEIIAEPSLFDSLYALIFDLDTRIAWKAAWACQKLSERNQYFFNDKHFKELENLCLSTKNESIRRGCLSILYHITFPNEISVDLINSCFAWMVSSHSSIAVQVYSMKLLSKICTIEPALKPELKVYLENINFEEYSNGFKSVRKNILKLLNKR